MYHVNISELAKLLDVGQYSLYPKLGYLRKDKTTIYRIDIDSFLNECKVSEFDFENEKIEKEELNQIKDFENKKSFLDRLRKTYDTPYITAKDVKNILNISDYELYLLRTSNFIESQNINRTRYKYKLESVKSFIDKNNLNCKLEYFDYSKQFYSPTEIIDLLSKKDINISLKSIYRYIYKYNVIPCIKVGGNLRIPMLEFDKYILPNINIIFKLYKNNQL